MRFEFEKSNIRTNDLFKRFTSLATTNITGPTLIFQFENNNGFYYANLEPIPNNCLVEYIHYTYIYYYL